MGINVVCRINLCGRSASKASAVKRSLCRHYGRPSSRSTLLCIACCCRWSIHHHTHYHQHRHPSPRRCCLATPIVMDRVHLHRFHRLGRRHVQIAESVRSQCVMSTQQKRELDPHQLIASKWLESTAQFKTVQTLGTVLFCSLAVLDPRVGYTMNVLSPFISLHACVHLALFFALYLSPRYSLVSSWWDHSTLASLLWQHLTVPSVLQLC